MAKAGRPKQEVTREWVVSFRLTADEYWTLEAMADDAGEKPGPWVRALVERLIAERQAGRAAAPDQGNR